MRALVKVAAAAAVLTAVAAGPAGAQAISSYVFSVMDMMRADIAWRETNAPANQGNVYFHGTVGSLNDDEERVDHLIGNWGGGAVTVAAYCDTDCSDLDLYVLDDLGNAVASDASVDARPIVTFRPLAERTYRLKVMMYQCNQAPCFYSSAAYYRSQ